MVRTARQKVTTLVQLAAAGSFTFAVICLARGDERAWRALGGRGSQAPMRAEKIDQNTDSDRKM